jgi:hypothetical protein
MNNDIDSRNSNITKCVDVLFLVITSVYFLGVLVLAVLNFNPVNLRDLSMPRNYDGQPCINSTLYV